MIRSFLLLIIFQVSIFHAGYSQKNRKTSDTPSQPIQQETKISRPKNIILMIGDGMGLTQITAGMYANGGNTALSQFQSIGLVKTHSADNLITDSAAGATAMSTGVKTYNKAIAVDVNGKPILTLAEMAEEKGMMTALIATSEITDATPACFYAHQPKRSMEYEIAADALKLDVDIYAGGGAKFFENRPDGRNIFNELAEKGYTVANTIEEADMAKTKFVYLPAQEGMPKMSEGRGDFLARMTKKMFKQFNNAPKGFFALIEGSQIDWGGHANDSQYIINEMIDFNSVIDMVISYAKQDGNTLVIVTADHETGGYGLIEGDLNGNNVGGKFIWGNHTATMVPVFAYGPGEENFRGIMENTDIFKNIVKSIGW
jgi:alkaline phosphatase